MADAQLDTAHETLAAKGREAQRKAAETAERVMEAERRTFEIGADTAERTARTGFETARDMARRGAETTRQLAESSRRTGVEIVDLWRSAWDPLLNAQFEANRWFDQFWRQATGLGALPALRSARPFAFSLAPLMGLPPADVKETDEAYILAIETPGLARQDIDLHLSGDALVVSGQKVEEHDVAAAAYRMSERRFGRFERSFPIPPDVRRQKISASCKDGLLTILLPKADEARRPAERIEIQPG